MPGFLSNYEGTERIWIDSTYWVDVKKCLDSDEWGRVQAHLGAGRQNVDFGGRRFATMDFNASQREMLVQCISAWNLDDPDGTVWPLEPEKAKRSSIARLPAPVMMQVYERCDELNGPASRQEQARFPDPDSRGDQGGDSGTAGTGELPGQESLLGETGPDHGIPEGTPLA